MNFRRLIVYQKAIELVPLAQKLVSRVPRGHREIRDQLRRAALSIPLNIAEGAGKMSIDDRKRFYAIARGSAMECGAVVDVMRLLDAAEAELLDRADGLLEELVRMLSTMSR